MARVRPGKCASVPVSCAFLDPDSYVLVERRMKAKRCNVEIPPDLLFQWLLDQNKSITMPFQVF